ncbi:MAG: hypothetical protein DHS20C12_25140 [Pseudohongiella sp.]|nr:MAG: hypothetical protein DHS20C12_25140 [Pseudohongiella sp.]
MTKLLALTLCSTLAFSQFAYAADSDCLPLTAAEGDDLVALISGMAADSWLQIDIDEEQACTVDRDSLDLDSVTAASYRLSALLDEFAVQATVEGYETWLRVDREFGGELLLNRATGEALDLTAAEFLGDNSQLEASDFFIEYVGTLELAGARLRNVETNIPMLDVTYDHYAGRMAEPEVPAGEVAYLTVGSIGEEILEEFKLVLDISNQLIYMTEAD